MKNESGFSLVELVIVVAIIGVLAAVSIVTFKPYELFANGRNARRIEDVNAINTTIGQWLAREGLQNMDPYDTLGLTDVGTTALSPGDGSITGEGVGATNVTLLATSGYLQAIPLDPDGTTEYRIGVDDMANPLHVLVCTAGIEATSSYPAATYPNGMFCQSN